MFLTETFVFPILFTIYFLGYYHYVMRQEEVFLSKKYGTRYSDYVSTTPRFLPSFKNFKEPDFYQVSPKNFRIFLGQVVWFIWVAALVQLFEELRLHGVLPSLFSWF